MVSAALGGTCNNCQEKGHRAYQCPKKAGHSNGNLNVGGNTKGKFSGTCNQCGKIGHKKSDCWQLNENKNKCPKNFRGGNTEHVHAAIISDSGGDKDGPGFLICAFCYGEDEGITAADYTCH
jgi:hypothetical protein